MKHERMGAWLASALLGFFTAWGALGCLVSAFDLGVERPGLLVLLCGISAAVSSLFLIFSRGGIVLGCLLALGLGWLYREGTAAAQLWQLCHHLSTVYNEAYDCGVLILPEGISPGQIFDWPLGLWTTLITAAVAASVCRQKTVWLPMGAVLLPLTSCIVVTDTVPEEVWLMMVMAGLILLLLTAPVRQQNSVQGLRLTAVAALPVLIALTALFLAVPQQGYVNYSEVFRENILTAATHLPQLVEGGMEELTTGIQGRERESLDLARLGPRIPFTYPVMEVTVPGGGRLYLRRQDFDGYDGLSWTSTDRGEEIFSRVSGEEEVVTIATRNVQELRFLTYHPAEEVTLRDGCLENSAGEQEYTLRRTRLPEVFPQAVSYGQWPEYCALPEDTRRDARVLLEGLYAETDSNTEKAARIADLVMNSAAYDLNPSLMPGGEPDFALWFLRDGERGYCVHFATAAAVLLRAAGIPARYVTGYMAQIPANETFTVTEEHAHAWAEYYEPGLDAWLPLEATPAEEGPAQTQATEAATQPTVPTRETVPETTAAATVPASTAWEPTEAPTAPPEMEPRRELPWAQLASVPLTALVLAGQRSLRLRLRRRRQRRGTSNQQALHRWRESLALTRLLKEIPTEELMGLAQKAKFSQHELTAEELLEFDSFNRSCLRRLKQKPWYLRLICKYICAAW